MRKAYVLGANTPQKFLRIMTEDNELLNLYVQLSDITTVRLLLEALEAEDDD